MPVVGRQNDMLAAMISESGCSFAGLARRVNQLGAMEGHALTYDYTAVGRWVKKGEHPRAPVPRLLAGALSELLGRTVTPAELGLTDAKTAVNRGLDYPADAHVTVDTILDLGRAELKRRSVIAAPFAVAALAQPSRDWLLASLDQTVGAAGPRRIGRAQIDSVRHMFRLFQELDVMRGGGHARAALVEYLGSHVIPLVRREHDPEIQTALYEAASEQTYLVGWMAYDDGMHGLAERYLIQSLRLAQAAGNRALGAHVLAGMSDQANLLGHPREALALALAGQRGTSLAESPACLADLQILEARAHAVLGDKLAAARAVARAESTFSRVVARNEAEWARFIDAAYVFGEAAHCFRDIGDVTQLKRFASESANEARRQRRARRGALSNAVLAIGDIAERDVDAAAARSIGVVKLASTVASSRCNETVRDLARRLKPYHALPRVQEFTVQANTLLGAA
jgi:hypothetical protein